MISVNYLIGKALNKSKLLFFRKFDKFQFCAVIYYLTTK
jgi:hypothetical protein